MIDGQAGFVSLNESQGDKPVQALLNALPVLHDGYPAYPFLATQGEIFRSGKVISNSCTFPPRFRLYLVVCPGADTAPSL